MGILPLDKMTRRKQVECQLPKDTGRNAALVRLVCVLKIYRMSQEH